MTKTNKFYTMSGDTIAKVEYKTSKLDITINLETYSNSRNWGHRGEIWANGEYAKAKIVYYNRTWERYKFESLIRNLLAKVGITGKQAQRILDQVEAHKTW